jgi:hypothetical protein
VIHEPIGKTLPGGVLSKNYAVYTYMDSVHQQLCWAYPLRNLTGIPLRAGIGRHIGMQLVGLR